MKSKMKIKIMNGIKSKIMGFPTNGGRAERVVSGCLERFGADIA
jgi:hypothetical protein